MDRRGPHVHTRPTGHGINTWFQFYVFYFMQKVRLDVLGKMPHKTELFSWYHSLPSHVLLFWRHPESAWIGGPLPSCRRFTYVFLMVNLIRHKCSNDVRGRFLPRFHRNFFLGYPSDSNLFPMLIHIHRRGRFSLAKQPTVEQASTTTRRISRYFSSNDRHY